MKDSKIKHFLSHLHLLNVNCFYKKSSIIDVRVSSKYSSDKLSFSAYSKVTGFIELRSNPLQATPTNSSYFKPFHAVSTHYRPLHLLQTTLKTQPHAIRNHSWLPNTFSNFISFFFKFNDWINHLNHYLE